MPEGAGVPPRPFFKHYYLFPLLKKNAKDGGIYSVSHENILIAIHPEIMKIIKVYVFYMAHSVKDYKYDSFCNENVLVNNLKQYHFILLVSIHLKIAAIL